MNHFLRLGLLAAASTIACSAAHAGETVLYGPAPAWVDGYELDSAAAKDGPSNVLYDWQYRFEDGMVYSYTDSVVRIDNPTALTQQGTLQLEWAPDKGDLTVHKLEIIRGGEVDDLVEDGLRFDVLRREQYLEWRLLDGRLTATLAVPGLQVGDLLRLSYSVSEDDQALGDDVQAIQYLPSSPWQAGFSRAVMSWPEGEDIRWEAGPSLDGIEAETRGGYRYVAIDLPVAKRADMPFDAPSRYRRAQMLRAGSFTDWRDLSSAMAPHFEKAAEIAPDGEVAAKVAEIAARTADPLERTVLAVRAVQDDVSYMLDGLDGGNYLPQRAEDTWDMRYGDCKAKSVLLLAMLRNLGIEAQVVLVASQGGDAIPELLPLPANFDHMIVRATIGGTEYWLDGTSAATRLNNVADVPPFFYALPLAAEGADLVPMTQRSKVFPDMAMRIVEDHSAGIDLPFLFRLEMDVSGPPSAQLRSLIDEDNPELLKQLANSASRSQLPGAQVTDISLDYDDEEALGTIVLEGVADAEFRFEDGKVLLGDMSNTTGAPFSPDRARRAWRDIPVRTAGPSRMLIDLRVLLPEGGEGYRIDGVEQFEGGYANTRISRKGMLEDGHFQLKVDVVQDLGEIAPDRLADEKRAALKLANSNLQLEAPRDAKWRWQYGDAERRRRAEPAWKAYDSAVEQAQDDDFAPLLARAQFFEHIFAFGEAVDDYSTVIEARPAASLYLARARQFTALGDMDAAIADIETAYDLDPKNETAFYLAETLGLEGRTQEALDLLDALPVGDSEMVAYTQAVAMVRGYSGDVEGGYAVVAELAGSRPDDAELLNTDCWYRGIFQIALEDALARCTKAVELAKDPTAPLDSRAMVRFRLGQYDQALADLDAVLALAPWMAASRFMRGVVSHAAGEGGDEEIATALRQVPQLGPIYARYGIETRAD